MNCWKVCVAFRRPKGIQTNSKRPNGVVTAVLGTSSGATGIWLRMDEVQFGENGGILQ